MHLDRYVAYWAACRRDDPYMTFEGDVLTWSEFDAKGEALASHLLEMGVQAGDRVGILLGNSLEWCIAFGAAIRVGAIIVPLNIRYGKFELQSIASDAECSVMISRPSEMEKLGGEPGGEVDPVTVFDMADLGNARTLEDILATGGSAPRCNRGDDDIFVICYTSGTTGLPKGIELSHRAVDTMAHRVGGRFGWEYERERLLILAPLAFTGGIVSNLAVQLVFGGSAWVEARVDPVRALDLIVEHELTMMAGVPALWERVASAPGFADADISSMRTAITGGAPVSMDLVKIYAAKDVIIRQQYGVSENSGCVCCPDRNGAVARPHSCGMPLPGVDIEIRDDDGNVVPDGTIGEICIRSGQFMRSYWRNPEVSEKALVDGWYLSGDLGHIDDHGGLVVADRKKNMLISGGVNIYPAEIERAMMTIDGIEEVVVFGRPSKEWGQQVTAIAYAPGHDSVDTIAAQARDLLGSMKAPKEIILSVERLPRTSSEKIARSDLDSLYDRVKQPVSA